MLQLKGIEKDYYVADTTVHALKGVDLNFRKSEFVSVLGPSGCGKTTLLNIIGGLDHYTAGDLVIDGVSTKDYTDRDWDTYRNHRIGFVFQSYNLIPHQTILENVELALTISGVDRAERVRRAKVALDKVGLKDQYNKKPNQLSGGQCQRVAIARALVNDPEILLADEPTGALDTVTSGQIMDLIQEIAKECLVIMVTHNPEIAAQYSTRIVRLLDGEVVEDSNPYSDSEAETELILAKEERALCESLAQDGTEEPVAKKRKKSKGKKSKLSWWQAWRLSARNLRSKIKRTLLVCLAGSIGIIGVATVLAVSTGVQSYIDTMQNDMLSGNPITVAEEALNMDALMESQNKLLQTEAVVKNVEQGKVNVNSMIEYLLQRSEDLNSLLVTNDITQDYVDYVSAMPEDYYAAISKMYGIDLTNNLYTDFELVGYEKGTRFSLSSVLTMYTAMLNKSPYADFAAYISTLSASFAQAPSSADYILEQYDILSDPAKSKIATEANEIMIVVDDKTELTDLLLAELGYYSQKEFFNVMYRAEGSDKYDEALWKEQFTYDELMGKRFTFYPNDTVYQKNDIAANPMLAGKPFSYNHIASDSWTTGQELVVTAILRPKKDLAYGCLTSGFYYTEALAEAFVANSLGLDDGTESEIVTYCKAQEGESITSGAMNGISFGVTYSYNFTMPDDANNSIDTLYENNVGYVGGLSMQSIIGSMMGGMGGGAGGGLNVISYTLSLRNLGGNAIPNELKIYPKNFELKDKVTGYLDEWNGDGDITVGDKVIKADERAEIVYSDVLALVIGLLNTMIDIVTYALVAFTALSLVVSTVMIAIITYVSVIERVKEIGVIRSLGGRKRDVSALFIAETIIIGGSAGLIGVGITYGLSGILNLIVRALAGIMIAKLTLPTALIMIAISIALTTVSGLIPARLAAKKDPVDALRSE